MSCWTIPSEAVTAFSALVGVALDTVLTHLYNRKRDHLELKRDVLRRALGYRWQLTPGRGSGNGEFFTVLNEIPAVFAGEKAVEREVEAFRSGLDAGFRAVHLPPLLKAMAKSARVPDKGWSEELLISPFAPPPGER